MNQPSLVSARRLRPWLGLSLVWGLVCAGTACGEGDGTATRPLQPFDLPGDDNSEDDVSGQEQPNSGNADGSDDQPTDGQSESESPNVDVGDMGLDNPGAGGEANPANSGEETPGEETTEQPGEDNPPPEETPTEPTPVSFEDPPVQCNALLANTGSQAAGDGDINVILNTEFQTVRGFGGMSEPYWTGADFTPEIRETIFGREPGQLGYSMVRVRLSHDPNEWNKDLETTQYAAQNGVRVIASPWTPPPNLKNNNDTGVPGFLLPQNYGAYADHLLAYVDFMAQNGVPVYAVSVQNEPDIEVDYDGCDWSVNQIADFLRQEGPRFDNVQLIASESFNFNPAYTDPLLTDGTVAPNFDIVGGHLYGRAAGPYDIPAARQQGKEIWMTEHIIRYDAVNGNPNLGTDFGNNWQFAFPETATEIDAAMKSNYSAYLHWSIRRTYSAVLDNGQVSKRGFLRSQYSRFVRPGFVRVEATDPQGMQGVDVTAYKNGPGKVVVVAINQADQPRTVALDVFGSCVTGFDRFTTSQAKNAQNDGAVALANGRVEVTLDAQSVTTFVSQDL